jgi:hypothetical protein
MPVQSKAQVVWQSDLVNGKGDVTAGRDAFRQMPISWATEQACPISNAVRGNITIRLNAALEETVHT